MSRNGRPNISAQTMRRTATFAAICRNTRSNCPRMKYCWRGSKTTTTKIIVDGRFCVFSVVGTAECSVLRTDAVPVHRLLQQRRGDSSHTRVGYCEGKFGFCCGMLPGRFFQVMSGAEIRVPSCDLCFLHAVAILNLNAFVH